MSEGRLVICAVASIGAHVVFATSLSNLPPRTAAVAPPRPIEVRVIEPPPPPPPPPPVPEPPEIKPSEPPKIHEQRRTRPRAARAATPVDTPSETAPSTTETTTTPVYGVTMSSSSSSGPAVAQGNTTRVAPATGTPGPAKPLASAAAAYEVTKMPVPLGRCAGKYTEAAKAAGIEGMVILDLVVDETGRARDIEVKQPLTHGLTEAAVAALRACTFTPGERAGTAVPVRVRSFKIRFVLAES
jgi:protein TonB